MGKSDEDSRSSAGLSRRSFITLVLSLPGTASLLKISNAQALGLPSPPGGWPEYNIRRARDELLLRVTAVGYAESRGRRILVPRSSSSSCFLVFTLPPQHFAETALTPTDIPAFFDETDLQKIKLLPSAQSRLVFRVPHRRALRLTADELLAWHQLELVLPDLQSTGQQYDLEVDESGPLPSTRIELPWGIQLSPASDTTPQSSYTFTDSRYVRMEGPWAELWTTQLTAKSPMSATRPIPMEVLSVRGFERIGTTGTSQDGNLVITYQNRAGQTFPDEPTPLNNYDRISLATSLSRRFPYTGVVGPPPIESGLLKYEPSNVCVSACYAEGRTVSVTQLRLSTRGGWLQLDGKWNPFPGCALSGWVHSASLGRDHDVKVIDEGFLYPFATPCELVLLSARAFAKDNDGHFVAPLIQQVFLQIPQPNSIAIDHSESPFKSISVTTSRSPPLDLPPTGLPETYRQYDFFLPTVNGQPFSFEHVGTDWGDSQHRSSMAMIYVSNKARLANGLIWEPGYSWTPTQASSGCAPTQAGGADAGHTIPQSGEGLRVVDRIWVTRPERFAQYNGSLVALARVAAHGDSSQRVDWIEWARGNVPDLAPTTIAAPFRPRARTMRIRIQATGQLSGEPSSSIATYRDVRTTRSPLLDPEPTTPPADYFANVTAGSELPDIPYLYMLETRALVTEPGKVAARSDDQVAIDVRDAYYRLSVTTPLPLSLFNGVDNEVRFGQTSSAEGIGALSVPDTHANNLTANTGMIGDATFNERRWSGYTGNVQAKLKASDRLDFVAFTRAQQIKLDLQPFQPSRTETDRSTLVIAARAVMGFAPAPAAPFRAARFAGPELTPGLKLGDLFGTDAQVIPGLRFADIFQEIALGGSGEQPSGERAAEPLSWNVRVGGIEWLAELLDGDPGSISLPDLITILRRDALPDTSAKPLSLYSEASLSWSNDIFKEVDVGPAKFLPTPSTKISIDAHSKIDLGIVSIPADGTGLKFSPGKPTISASTSIVEFAVEIFSAVHIDFSTVAFDLSEDGKKSFKTGISGVDLLPPLDFINQIARTLSGLGSDQGIHVDLNPQRVRLSQTLRFPATDGMPLFMGPAQVINLALSWFVSVPLIGRDVLAVGFGLSSRVKPLTIYVPPWYGGKAYALLEATTKGCRLVEVSMEYGALVPITWGIATGQASLTAGIFFSLQRDDPNHSAKVVLQAFVKAAADLTVAGIIQFAGLIYIALSYIIDGGQKTIQGIATISVSIKIGFFRVSYSFTAEHKEVSGNQTEAAFVAAEEFARPTALAGRARRAETELLLGAHRARPEQSCWCGRSPLRTQLQPRASRRLSPCT